jgi:hypothetical protein
MFAAKRRYRRWTGGGHRVHATQNRREAERDLFLLLGRRSSSYAGARWDGSIRTAPGDLFGAEGWRDLRELCTAFELSLPYVLVGDAGALACRDEQANRLIFLADERWEPAMVARGESVDGGDGTRRRLVKVGGRRLVCEFVEADGDPVLTTLLASRVRAHDGVWIPADRAAVPERWR